MARIRQYQRQVQLQGQLRGRATAETFGSSIGRAVGQLGQVLGQEAQRLQQRREKQAQLENERIVSEERIFWQKRLDEMQQGAPPGAPEFTDQVLDEYKDRSGKLLEDRPTTASRQHLDQNLLRLQDQLASKAISFQSEASAQHEIQQVEETVANDLNAVRADPSLMPEILEGLDQLSSELPVDAQRQTEFRNANRPNVGFSAVMGRLDTVEAPSEATAIEEELLEEDFWKDLLTPSQYAQALNRSRQLRDSLGSQIQRDYAEGFKEQARQWEKGLNLDAERYTPEDIQATVDDPELQEELINRAAHSKRIGAQSNWMRMASPGDIAARREELQARIADPIDRPGEHDEAAREFEAFEQALDLRGKALENDRAGYVRDNSERVNRAYTSFMDDPSEETMDEYVNTSISEQRRIGVPEGRVRILPNEYAAQLAQRLTMVERTPAGAQEYFRSLQGMQTEFGKHWPLVQRQLEEQDVLTGPAAVAAGMTGPMESRIGQQIIQASAQGADQLKAQVNVDKLDSRLSEELADNMAEFQNTVAVQTGGGQAFVQHQEAIELLALQKMALGESNVGTAVETAYNEVLGNRYSMVGTYRIPTTIEHSPRAIERSAAGLRRRIGELPLVVPDTLAPGVEAEQVREAWVSTIKSEGYWITSGDESGLEFVDPLGNQVTMDIKGETVPVKYGWDEIAAHGEDTLPSLPRSSLLMRGGL